MKLRDIIKHFLMSICLWLPFNFIKTLPDFFYWLGHGGCGAPPYPVKLLVVVFYLRKYSLEHFIETGTFLGDTLAYIARTGVQCTSIELSHDLYLSAHKQFKAFRNVNLIQGDSAEKLPTVIENLGAPALFWLDGHYSGNITACGSKHSPIIDEIQSIFTHAVKNHVILIDDARLFNGKDNYPLLSDLLLLISKDGSYTAEVSMDIIRLIPKE